MATWSFCGARSDLPRFRKSSILFSSFSASYVGYQKYTDARNQLTFSASSDKTISHLQAILRLLDVNCTVIPCTIIDLGGPNSHIVEVQLRLVLQHAAELLQDFVFGMSESGYLE